MAKKKKIDDGSAEQKIKEAARKLFTEKGFDAVKTRDIAAEAGINLALLNYYFRSKEKLFDIVMIENFEQFIQQLIPVFGDERLTIEERFVQITARYIDMLKTNPDLPFFIMNQMKSDSSKLLHVREKMATVREAFIQNLGKNMKGGKATPTDIAHFMMNYMGLVIFPFISRPMVMKVNGLSDKQFDDLMEERKAMVPVWLNAIMKGK
jgi:AcrR family transcriptional regulator